MLKTKLGNKGSTLLEVMMSASIVTISFWGAMAGLQYLWKGIAQRKVYSNEIALVQKVMTNIRSNPAQFYVLPSNPAETSDTELATAAEFPVPDPETKEYSDPEMAKFQYAFDSRGLFFGRPADCPKCDGRMMYVLQPYGSVMPGSLKATVRIVRLEGKKQVKVKDHFSFMNYE